MPSSLPAAFPGSLCPDPPSRLLLRSAGRAWGLLILTVFGALGPARPGRGQSLNVDSNVFLNLNQNYTYNDVLIGGLSGDGSSANLIVTAGAGLTVTASLTAGDRSAGALTLSNNTRPNAFGNVFLGSAGFEGTVTQTGGVTTTIVGGLFCGRGSYTLQAGGALAMGTCSITSSLPNTLTCNGSATVSGAATFPSGTIRVHSGGTLSVGSLSSGSGGTAVIQLGDPNASTPALTVGGDHQNTTFAGQLVDFGTQRGGLRKVGTGTLVLPQSQTYTGPTLVLGGTLTVANAASTLRGFSPLSDITVANGALLRLAGTEYNQIFRSKLTLASGGTVDAANPASNAHTLIDVTFAGGRLTNSVAANPTYGAYVLEPGTFLVTGAVDSTLDATVIQFQGARTITVDAGARLLLSSTIQNHTSSGTLGSLLKNGPGTLVLGGSNSYAGGTQVTEGMIELPSPSALGAGGANVVLNGGGLRWQGAGFDPSPRLAALGANGGRFDLNSQTATFASALSGAGGVTVFGPGRLTFSVANAYQGDTTIASGTLALGPGGTLGAGLVLTNAGTFDVTAKGTTGFFLAGGRTLNNTGAVLGTLVVGGTFRGGGSVESLTVQSGALVEVTAPLTLAGAVVNQGTIRVAGGAALEAQSATSFVNHGILDLIEAGPATTLPTITGSGLVLTPSSVKVKTAARAGSNVTLTIDSYDGHIYSLQRATDLAAAPTAFQPVTVSGGGPLPSQPGATGTTLTFTDANAPAGEVFYRVVLNP